MTDYAIEVKQLVKKFGNHYAVQDLSFQLGRGRIYGLLGPNGAGKSTTMNMITGYIASTSGEITINGYNILTEPEKAKRCIGYLPEIPPLYTELTVYEYLLTVSELKRIPRKEQKEMIGKVMNTVMITDMKNRLIKNLSKGYRQRVGIAQALIGDPEIIILDEPTVGLDPKQIIEIRELIKNLKQRHTVILSSHILSEISAVCDEILIINKGRLIASAAAEELEKSFPAKNSLELIVEGVDTKIKSILAEFTDIESVQIEKHEEQEDLLHIYLQIQPSKDLRRELFYSFADARCPILEMHSSTLTLEDVFLELTGREPLQQAENQLSDQADTEPDQISALRTGRETETDPASALRTGRETETYPASVLRTGRDTEPDSDQDTEKRAKRGNM